MEQEEIIEITQQALMLIIQISSPIMIIGLLVGVAIALIQALTQVQEMTLAFVPKMVAIFVAIFLLFPTMVGLLTNFMHQISDTIINLG